jgi:uncharacterized small protein (DUF1192 family)
MTQPVNDETAHLKTIVGDLVMQIASLMAERDRLRAELAAKDATKA